MSFLGIGKKKQKKAAAAANATLDKLMAGGQQLSESNQRLALMASDGKISNKEKKLMKQAARQEGKTARVDVRSSNSVLKTVARADARKSAYDAGIDPRAWIGDSLGEISKGVVGVAAAGAAGRIGTAFANRGSNAGGGNNSLNSLDTDEIMSRINREGSGVPSAEIREEVGFPVPGDNSKMIMIVGGILVLFFILKKR